MFKAAEVVKKDPAWLAAIAKRGLDPEKVQVEPWPGAGYTHPKMPKGHRSSRVIFSYMEDEDDNQFGRPIHGLNLWFDVTAKRIIEMEDNGVVPLPQQYRFDLESIGP